MSQSAAVVELQTTGIDAATDRHAEDAELGVGPPADTGLAVEMADDGGAEVVFGLLVCGVLTGSPAVAVRVDHAVDYNSAGMPVSSPSDP